MTGRIESAIRRSVSPGELLATPTGRGQFKVAHYTTEGLVLLLGAKEAWTPLPWQAMEGVPNFLRGRDWVAIGGLYSTDSQPARQYGRVHEVLPEAGYGRLGRCRARARRGLGDQSFPACPGKAALRLIGDARAGRETRVSPRSTRQKSAITPGAGDA